MKRENNVSIRDKVVKKLLQNGCTNIISLQIQYLFVV